MKDLHKDLPNPILRSEFLNLYMETDALVEYRNSVEMLAGLRVRLKILSDNGPTEDSKSS